MSDTTNQPTPTGHIFDSADGKRIYEPRGDDWEPIPATEPARLLGNIGVNELRAELAVAVQVASRYEEQMEAACELLQPGWTDADPASRPQFAELVATAAAAPALVAKYEGLTEMQVKAIEGHAGQLAAAQERERLANERAAAMELASRSVAIHLRPWTSHIANLSTYQHTLEQALTDHAGALAAHDAEKLTWYSRRIQAATSKFSGEIAEQYRHLTAEIGALPWNLVCETGQLAVEAIGGDGQALADAYEERSRLIQDEAMKRDAEKDRRIADMCRVLLGEGAAGWIEQACRDRSAGGRCIRVKVSFAHYMEQCGSNIYHDPAQFVEISVIETTGLLEEAAKLREGRGVSRPSEEFDYRDVPVRDEGGE